MAFVFQSVTPGGIEYSMLMRGYNEVWVRDASHITAVLKIRGIDAADFKDEMVGYTLWSPGSSTLTRNLPFLCPYTNTLRCQSLELVSKGWRRPASLTDHADPFFDNWLDFDRGDTSWVFYSATFSRPPWNGIVDDQGMGGYTEKDRYCTISLKTEAREQKLSSYTVEADGRPLNEPWFRPDYNTIIKITWHQIPAYALPLGRWNARVGMVNNAAFTLRLMVDPGSPIVTKSFVAEKVKFYGPMDELLPHPGADGRLYYSPTLLFSARGGPDTSTWNTYAKADGTYAALTIRGTANKPHFSTDFAQIFLPGDA